MPFLVRKMACETCIYREDNPLDLNRLEDEVRDSHVGFASFRICHDHADAKDEVCCRGFWNRHKDAFALGQVAQRLNQVHFV